MNFLANSNFLPRLAGALFGLGTFASIAKSAMYTVDGGERALIFDRTVGIKEVVRGEGTHFLVPWFQKPIIVDVKTTPKSLTSDTGSKDLQIVNITLRVLFRPDVTKLKDIISNIGAQYDERILPSIGNEVLKAVVAEFDAGELITRREEVSRKIRDKLTLRANDFGILLDDVSITHLTFSRDYTRAIEQKQVAQQVAERQKFVVEKAKQEKLAEVILAEGETESARLITDAMKSGNEFLMLRKIEASREIAQTLSASSNVVYLPNGSNVLMSLPTR
eukprot:CAMPEP_0184343960 /NCGR_PEP_ID=MMETSP1089-20130417/12479_1 /TAXON_ID=38269 ORGANISM="Gloeochaete wittrockiana, Strain SAG46.84" /NCGR_SAMPLE_ID=MMETSP1089 /ASSEMBLY_ACC=CAM_ASM_000445 /LENGTH=276 /DNA_ID=CAMNT_0026673535 /DNA_START=27 /DNA_END=857 /DNA_ORIENTATION=+